MRVDNKKSIVTKMLPIIVLITVFTAWRSVLTYAKTETIKRLSSLFCLMNTLIFSNEGSNYLKVPEINLKEYINSYADESQVSARVTQYKMWKIESKIFAGTSYESCRSGICRKSYLPKRER